MHEKRNAKLYFQRFISVRNKDYARSFAHIDLSRVTLPGISYQRPLSRYNP